MNVSTASPAAVYKMGPDNNIGETCKKRRLISDSEVKPVKLPNIDLENKDAENVDFIDNKHSFNLIVSNLPEDWNYDKLHTFFIKLFIFNKLEYQDDGNFDGTVKLIFNNMKQCEIAIQKLDNAYADDRKLHWKSDIKEENIGLVETMVLPDKSELQTPPSSTSESNNELSNLEVQAIESFEIDPSGLYGLKPSFLASLGIKPPIDNWVHVSNFRCDEPQLRNVMGLAGQIVVFSGYLGPKYAKVMYSHPLEAVQAVSMLNGREYYGNKLKIIMIPNPGDLITLPKGLAGLGPGLGSQGKPLREIEKHFRRFLSRKPTALNMSIFRQLNDNQQFMTINDEDTKIMTYVPKSSENSEKTKNENKVTDGDNSRKKVSKLKTYKHSSDSDLSLSSPEPDYNNSKSSGDKTTRASLGSGSSNCSSMSKNQLNTSAKNIETVSSRQNLRAQNTGPQWTPNMPFSNAAQPSFGPRQMPGFPGKVGPRFNNPVGIASQGPMQTHMTGQIRQTAPINQFGPVGQPAHMVHSEQRPSGPMGPIRPHMQMGPGPIGPQRQMGPSGPMGPHGQMGNSGLIRPSALMGSSLVGATVQNSEPVMLEIKNLPLNTTMPFLCQQLSDIGQVVSLQFTTPGCALVRFANMAQAQMCFQRYHRTFAEGCLLELRFV